MMTTDGTRYRDGGGGWLVRSSLMFGGGGVLGSLRSSVPWKLQREASDSSSK